MANELRSIRTYVYKVYHDVTCMCSVKSYDYVSFISLGTNIEVVTHMHICCIWGARRLKKVATKVTPWVAGAHLIKLCLQSDFSECDICKHVNAIKLLYVYL